MNTKKTDVVVGGTPRRYDGRAGRSVLYSNLLALVVLLSGVDDSHGVGSFRTISE